MAPCTPVPFTLLSLHVSVVRAFESYWLSMRHAVTECVWSVHADGSGRAPAGPRARSVEPLGNTFSGPGVCERYSLHTAYKFCNRTQYPCAGILLRQATGFDGHPAASNSAMPCPGARPALADRAPSMPEIATGLAPKGTDHCAYMIPAVTVGAKCNSC